MQQGTLHLIYFTQNGEKETEKERNSLSNTAKALPFVV